ncbi:Lactate dehydrogenase [Pseudomonas sp. NFACC23-1]|uniref:NAD(P)-dependent oxidoreductase n=1 Tax=unclassified Pseudomonas TaxID=196821 RepID=UPI000888CF4C|nr:MULTISPECIES: NAD(P)-dependent oxidoreductase [unclassified Pseudomonas]SDB37383.1 Lactate dehydrogenase [Pseudomonas sp. NFACC17-2]SEJ54597.1 Lactate dehydrogenase [Pseudomonas sp. NFACC23-1]SFW71950.1 Lactate dehydrogenase [Pseudomonas sp. NFACC16-2]
MRKVLITGDFDIDRAVFPNSIEPIHIRRPVDEQQLLELLPDVHTYILGGPEYLSARLIDKATQLRHVVVMGTGTASFVDIDYATKKSIRLTNTPYMNVKAVAEFTLAMLTMCLAKVPESIEGVKEGGRWIQTPRPSLSALSIGFVGMGAIGTEMAHQLHLRGCSRMTYWSRTRKPAIEKNLSMTYASVKDIVGTMDVVCIHLAGCPETRHLINEDVLKNASPTIKIFNMSSPWIICPVALKDFLCTRPEAFCYIDGYYNEWVENRGQFKDPYGLLSLSTKSLVVTSHLAAQEQGTISAIFAKAVKQVVDFS